MISREDPVEFLRYAAEHLHTSYASQAQDLWVLWLLGDSPGWFAEVGAFDGVRLSNSLLLEHQGWSGLAVEPLTVPFAALTEARTCHALKGAVAASHQEEGDFLQLPGAPHLSRLASTTSAVDIPANHRIMSTRLLTIGQALYEVSAPPIIDYLSLNTGGNELEILHTFPFDTRSVCCLTVQADSEAFQGNIESFLESKGFVRVFSEVSGSDGWYTDPNTLAAARGRDRRGPIATKEPVRPQAAREAHIQLGHTMIEMGLVAEATKVASATAATTSENIMLHRLRVAIAEKSEDSDKIGQAYENLSAAAPELTMPAVLAAAWRRLRDEPSYALAILDRCTSDQPGIDANRGNILITLERPEDALLAFDAALATDPTMPIALLGRADALRRTGRPTEALDHLRLHCEQLISAPGFGPLIVACTIAARSDMEIPFVSTDLAVDDLRSRTARAVDGAEAVVAAARDNDAGGAAIDATGRLQKMFDGIEIPSDGDWTTQLVEQTADRLDSQAEHVLAHLLKHVGSAATIIELGTDGCFYPAWLSTHREPDPELVAIQPDPAQVAKHEQTLSRNAVRGAVLYGRTGHVESAVVARDAGAAAPAQVTVQELLDNSGWKHLTVLHADIQGAERHLAEEIEPLLESQSIDFVHFLTHGRGDHVTMLRTLQHAGYQLVAEYSAAESFSGAGLIVARRADLGAPDFVSVPVRKVQAPAQRAILQFIHCPKTGGSAMNQHLRELYQEHYYRDSPPDGFNFADHPTPDTVRCISSHRPRGFERCDAFADVLFAPFALIRHPVDRMVSLYNDISRRESHPWHELAGEMDPDEFFDALESKEDHRFSALSRQIPDEEYRKPTGNGQSIMVAGTADIETVIDIVRNEYLAIAPIERHDELTQVLADEFEWLEPMRSAARHNVSEHRLTRNMLAPDRQARIEARNQTDLALYEYVTTLDTPLVNSLATLRRRFRKT